MCISSSFIICVRSDKFPPWSTPISNLGVSVLSPWKARQISLSTYFLIMHILSPGCNDGQIRTSVKTGTAWKFSSSWRPVQLCLILRRTEAELIVVINRPHKFKIWISELVEKMMSKMKGDDGGDCMCTHACVRACVCVCFVFLPGSTCWYRREFPHHWRGGRKRWRCTNYGTYRGHAAVTRRVYHVH